MRDDEVSSMIERGIREKSIVAIVEREGIKGRSKEEWSTRLRRKGIEKAVHIVRKCKFGV